MFKKVLVLLHDKAFIVIILKVKGYTTSNFTIYFWPPLSVGGGGGVNNDVIWLHYDDIIVSS